MTDSTPSGYRLGICPTCGVSLAIYGEDNDETECACAACGTTFRAGEARNSSTPTAAPSKPNPAGPDPETIRNYARPAFYLSYVGGPNGTDPVAVWTVVSEPDREPIGEIYASTDRLIDRYDAYVIYSNLEPRIGRFPDLWSAAQAIHNVSQHVI